jgi:hypothetical protein
VTLHMTKLAYGCASLADLTTRVASRVAAEGSMFMTTRYKPKRHAEIVAGGSLFWIIKHQLVARATIHGFADNGEGRINILLEPRVIPVSPYPRRAHQGWRYLEAPDAPPDLMDGEMGGDELPTELIGELAELSLI